MFVFEAAIDLLSFIQLFPKDWKKRSYLSLGGVSSVALMTFLSECPQITSVFLCLDNDRAGNEACEKLAGEISEGYSVIRLKPSRKDWNEILCDKNTDRKKAIAETITIKVPETEELVPMLCYEDIKQTSVEWLWFPYIGACRLPMYEIMKIDCELLAICNQTKYKDDKRGGDIYGTNSKCICTC